MAINSCDWGRISFMYLFPFFASCPIIQVKCFKLFLLPKYFPINPNSPHQKLNRPIRLFSFFNSSNILHKPIQPINDFFSPLNGITRLPYHWYANVENGYLKLRIIIFKEGKFLFNALIKICCEGRQVVSASSIGKPGESITKV